MALRVARGLFRLWLILSVLWIGGVGIAKWRTFIYPEVVVCEEVEAPAPGSCLPRSFVLDPQWKKDRRAAFQFALVLALVPPAVLLALGSALVWAFKGFRKD
jgi:hypothetical protein